MMTKRLLVLIAATVLFVSAFPALALAQTPLFTASRDIPVGNNPVAVAVGDFNGDGIRDMAVVNYNSNSVSVLLGRSGGTFQPGVTLAVGVNPLSIAAGDVNRDGRLDLVVANSSSGTVSVLLGNGDGTFQAAQTFAAGAVPVSVAVGDFNGDGWPDLVVANFGSSSSSVSVLLNNGAGGFGTPVAYGVGASPVFVVVGDFDGDGRLDLAVANSDSNTVSVVLGNGNGTFQTAKNFATGIRPWSIAVGDVDRDGRQDLVVANYASDTVSVLLNNGGGTLRLGGTLAVGGTPDGVAVGDVNGDGWPDIVVANAGSSTLSVLLGTGGGNFQSALTLTASSRPWGVAIGDFNGDGRQDLAVANYGSTTVSVLLGNGDGTFPAALSYSVGTNPQSIGVGDFNGDGVPDLAIANAGSDTITVLLGTAGGGFRTGGTFPAGPGPVSVAVGDFDGDGKLDLAVANYGSGCPSYVCNTTSKAVSILWGKGDGTFEAPQSLTAGVGPNSVAVGDFNGDGRLDLAVANYGVTHGESGEPHGNGNTVSVLLNTGNRTFQPASTFTAGPGSAFVTVADLDGDGRQDLVVANYGCNSCKSSVSVLRGNGNGTFQTAVNVLVDDGAWSVAVGDFNRDGVKDLAVVSYLAQTVGILLGNGDGTFRPAPVPLLWVDRNPSSVVAGDFNGDGVTDLAVVNYRSTTVSVLLGNGDGTFQSAQNFGAGSGPFTVATADVNGDGVLDLITANYDATTISVLLGTTRGGAVTLLALTVSPPSVVGGSSAVGTVTLNGPAPTGGAQVTLTSSNPTVATVPTSVTVAAGTTSATFAVSTSAVTASTPVTISGSYGGVTQTATLTVSPPLVSALVLNPSTVTGGAGSTGTVTMDGPAPAGGAQITLTSSNTAVATVPGSVTVPEGATSATFAIGTSVVTASTSVTISTSYGGATRSATLTVNPSVVLSSLALSPTTVIGGLQNSTGTVTLDGPAPAGGAQITLTSSNTAVATVPGSVTVLEGATSATFAIGTSAVTASTSVTISTSYAGATRSATLTVNPSVALSSLALSPTTVIGGLQNSTGTVTLDGAAPAGGALVTLSSNNAAAAVPPSVTVPAGATSTTFPVSTSAVTVSTAVTISASYGGAIRIATLTVIPTVRLSALTLSPTTVTGSAFSTGTVTLDGPAPAGGAAVALSSNNTAATVPGSVMVPGGATSATFAVSTKAVATSTSVTVSASYSGTTQTAILTVIPPVLTSLAMRPPAVTGGTSSIGTVMLDGPAPAGGAQVVLSSDNPAVATAPDLVTVPAGARSATFAVATHAVGATTAVTISASYGGSSRAASLTVLAPVLSSLTLSPTTVTGGLENSTGTVTLNGPAPPGGAQVALSSSNPSVASVPSSVMVPAGATSATFTVTTSIVVLSQNVTISGFYNGSSRSATLTVRLLPLL